MAKDDDARLAQGDSDIAEASDGLNDEVEAPWDEQTDAFIDDIDQSLGDAYDIGLRSLLLDPASYAYKAGIKDEVEGIRKEVSAYFENLMADLEVEQQQLTTDMEAADALYTKLDQLLSSKATVARIPYIKPAGLDLGDSTPVSIVLDQYNNGVDGLMTKFINVSNCIANISTTYQKYNLGSWLFSGERDYILSVKQPESVVLVIEGARDYITDALEDAADTISNASPSTSPGTGSIGNTGEAGGGAGKKAPANAEAAK